MCFSKKDKMENCCCHVGIPDNNSVCINLNIILQLNLRAGTPLASRMTDSCLAMRITLNEVVITLYNVLTLSIDKH